MQVNNRSLLLQQFCVSQTVVLIYFHRSCQHASCYEQEQDYWHSTICCFPVVHSLLPQKSTVFLMKQHKPVYATFNNKKWKKKCCISALHKLQLYCWTNLFLYVKYNPSKFSTMYVIYIYNHVHFVHQAYDKMQGELIKHSANIPSTSNLGHSFSHQLKYL